MELLRPHQFLPLGIVKLVGDYVGAGLFIFFDIKDGVYVSNEMKEAYNKIPRTIDTIVLALIAGGDTLALKQCIAYDDKQKSLVVQPVNGKIDYKIQLTYACTMNVHLATFDIICQKIDGRDVDNDDIQHSMLVVMASNRVDYYRSFCAHVNNADRDFTMAAVMGSRNICDYIEMHFCDVLSPTMLLLTVCEINANIFTNTDVIRYRDNGANIEACFSNICIIDKRREEYATLFLKWMDNKFEMETLLKQTSHLMIKHNVNDEPHAMVSNHKQKRDVSTNGVINHLNYIHTNIIMSMDEDRANTYRHIVVTFASVESRPQVQAWLLANHYI